MLMNNASVYACMLCILLCIMSNFLISALIYPCLCSWGCLPICFGVRRVLFAGLSDRDVTVWYQSSWLQQWASMGQEGAVKEGRITFSVQQNSSEQTDSEKWSKCE